jgi:predicted ABC-type ATPase
MKKTMYIIAGCNGAGKTTASFTILPTILNCKEFVNADEIARGISPFQPEKVGIESGRIMLNRINELLEENQSFAFETTLASKIYRNKIRVAQAKGFNVTLLFFWLQDVHLAFERVKLRVREGGHGIKKEVIRRRYFSGINYLFSIYLSVVDEALIFDTSDARYELIAEKSGKAELSIVNGAKFDILKEQALCDGSN